MNRIEICNLALTNIGMEPIESENAEGAETVLNAYTSNVNFLISAYPWSFTRRFRELGKPDQPPKSDWRYAYRLPAGRSGPPRAYYSSKADAQRGRALQLFDIVGNEIHCDEPRLFARFHGPTDPAFWPGYFIKCVQLAIEADLALSVREDKVLQREKLQALFGTPSQGLEGGYFGDAKAIDAQGTPAESLVSEGGDLIEARF